MNAFRHAARSVFLLLVTAVLAVAMTLLAAPAQAQAAPPYGPDPTLQSISADRGPFQTTTSTVPGFFQFGSVKAYYPTNAGGRTFGVVAICPGFVSRWSQMAWLGPRLASQGFVVLGLDTTTPVDFPVQRGDQLVASINAAKSMPAISGIADFSRVAVSGWSMGGGGALDIARSEKYKAVLAIAPFELGPYPISTPALVMGGQTDVVAPAPVMAQQFYNQARGPKVYAEIGGAAGNHFFTTFANDEQAAVMVAFLKRFVDDDTRYAKFLAPPVPGNFSAFKSSGITTPAVDVR